MTNIEIPEQALTVSSYVELDGEWTVRIEMWGEVVYEKSVHRASRYAWSDVEFEVKREFAAKLRKLLGNA